ncbi:MAG: monovalent cation/H+ antiporter complex subunit F [Trueperaceae bacterium]|nr:monovalent cation/H+ antiporter complex subunit F [Trueperaceae bacterium]MDZ7799459.1 monovalent cation/H+ antiporter complex subunit F [Trueperaceae bacterium]
MILFDPSFALLDVTAYLALTGVAVSIALALYRVIRGPSLPDRVMALDMIGLMAVSVIALVAIATRTAVLLDAAIALALISFLGTIAFARFIERQRSDRD